MSRKKGKIVYVPEIAVQEADNIMKDINLKSRSEAFIEMAKYSRVGREVDKIGRLDLLWDDFFGRKRRKNGG